MQATFSAWIPDPSLRFYDGIGFDLLVGICFFFNVGYVIYMALTPAILHLKRRFLRRNKKIQKKTAEPPKFLKVETIG